MKKFLVVMAVVGFVLCTTTVAYAAVKLITPVPTNSTGFILSPVHSSIGQTVVQKFVDGKVTCYIFVGSTSISCVPIAN